MNLCKCPVCGDYFEPDDPCPDHGDVTLFEVEFPSVRYQPVEVQNTAQIESAASRARREGDWAALCLHLESLSLRRDNTALFRLSWAEEQLIPVSFRRDLLDLCDLTNANAHVRRCVEASRGLSVSHSHAVA